MNSMNVNNTEAKTICDLQLGVLDHIQKQRNQSADLAVWQFSTAVECATVRKVEQCFKNQNYRTCVRREGRYLQLVVSWKW